MKDKINIEHGKSYAPEKKTSSNAELVGDYWRAWTEGGKYYYECDVGHFATNFSTVEIQESDFELLKSGGLSNADLERKYLA
ncbi:MAG TPA: hypothetical protein PKZ52_19000 [Cellvibrionaceae bacterium]|nr:hypothetical protein [Cellvibrionaceae bacterium]